MTAAVAEPVGLTASEVERSRREHGSNDIARHRAPGVSRLVLAQLREPVILLLLVAAAITIAVSDWSDASIILAVIVVNTVLGTSQEWRSNRAISALSQLTAPRATVCRDGRFDTVPARDVVVGDLLQLQAGDIVAADGRLSAGHSLAADESILTGESVPRTVLAGELVLGGTVIVRGHAEAEVVAVGGRTELGRLAATLDTAPATHTPMQRRLARLGQQLAAGAALAAVLVVLLNLVAGQSWQSSVVLGLSLAVAAIPESLPAVVTLSLALSARRMAQGGVLIRHLPAVEALGSITVLACDKTGTLTEGRIGVGAVWTPAGVPVEELWRCAVLCNDACHTPDLAPAASDDPLDAALVAAALHAGVDVAAVRAAWPRLSEEPFDAASAVMRSTHRCDRLVQTDPIEFVKGAPEAVLAECAAATGPAVSVVSRFAAAGDRTLALASRQRGPARLLGVLALTDPVRTDSAELIDGFRAAGVRPVMITGDHPLTAAGVARAVGILDGEESVCIPTGEHIDTAAAVFARTRPTQKSAIVAGLRGAGEVVAMTGDGVNDAAALRAADLGVAMGRGTEVAKQAADIVLVDDGLGAMVPGIVEGRRVAANIGRFLRYGLSGGAAEVLVMVLGPLLGITIPLRAGQILWVNLLTHGLPGVAIGAEPGEPGMLSRGPRRDGGRLVGGADLAVICGLACGIAAGSLSAGVIFDGHAQSQIFLSIVLCQLAVAIGLRPGPWWRLGSNPLLAWAILLNVALAGAAVYWRPLQELLHTRALSSGPILYAVAAAVLVGVLARLLSGWPAGQAR
ncbi:MAG TPA: cation-transporting P-type ATPase [Jatrophihabitans sp.]|nr:cation-transporting P-type ATPase [Jatrophihabitans sp.]